MKSMRKLKCNSTRESPKSYIMSENRASNRTYSFSILTENNLNNTFQRVYDEVKNPNVKVDTSKDSFRSDVPAYYYKR